MTEPLDGAWCPAAKRTPRQLVGPRAAGSHVTVLPPCRFGRKFLLIEGGIQLLICEIIVGILIAVGIGASGAVCVFVLGCGCAVCCKRCRFAELSDKPALPSSRASGCTQASNRNTSTVCPHACCLLPLLLLRPPHSGRQRHPQCVYGVRNHRLHLYLHRRLCLVLGPPGLAGAL